MALNIVALLLVLGITFMQSLFGLFSGLINLVCCVTAMVVAFGFSEALNDFLTQQGVPSAYALPASFVGLFVLSHALLRGLADNYLRGNVHVPMYLDWIGGGICGLAVALVSVGVFVLGFAMLPWGGRAMGFSRYERTDSTDPRTGRVEFRQNRLWVRADEFAVGLFNLLSGGSLRHKTAFSSVYPDFAEWVFWSGNTVQPESTPAPVRDSQHGDGFGTNGLRVQQWWEQKGSVRVRYRAKLPTKDDFLASTAFEEVEYKPEAGRRLIGMRLGLQSASADPDKTTRYHRFRPTMIRLVGTLKSSGSPRHYRALILGGADPETDELRLADIDNNFAIPATQAETPLDVYFEVDEDFVPQFVEYRRFARAPVPATPVAQAPGDRLIGPPALVEGTGGGKAVGGLTFVRVIIKEGTGFRTELPVPLARSALSGVEIRDGKLLAGRVAGPVKQLQGTGADAVREFAVPEGAKLFQLRCKARQAESLAGKVFNFVGSVVNQYIACSNFGGQYPMVGYYAIVKRDGADYLELFIAGPDDASYRSMFDFKYIKNTELRSPDAIIGLLFYVRATNPKEAIVWVETQTRARVEFEVGGYPVNP
jgi:hypothetical protein